MSVLQEALEEVYPGDQSLEANALADKLADQGYALTPVTLRARFEDKLVRVGDCLEWTGHRVRRGYGVMRVVEGGKSRLVRAHRLAWELEHGSIPTGMFVCHRCDNPPCCDIDHLFLGTPADNNADRAAKGRTVSHFVTDSNPNRTLTVEQRAEARALRSAGMAVADIADRVGTSRSNISYVVKGCLPPHTRMPRTTAVGA